MAEEQKTQDTSSKISEAANTASNIASQKVAQKIGTQIAAKTGIKAAATAAGSAVPGIGNAVAYIGTEAALQAKKYWKQLTVGLGVGIGAIAGGIMSGVGAVIGAAASGVAVTIGIAAITVPILIALIMFIINSGAYVAPFGNLTGGGGWQGSVDFGDIEVGASCPIPNGQVLWGSYGSPYSRVGHGTNLYWASVGMSCNSYTIPEFSSCTSKQPGDLCYNQGNSCSFYGYAADFIYPNIQVAGQPIFLPYINGESVTWTLVPGTTRGHSGMLIANQGGKVYEMLMIHLEVPPVGGQSGDVTGVLQNYRTPHVHVELRIDGQYVPPEFMCVGDNANGTAPPPESNSCVAQGGQCWDPVALGLLDPDGPPNNCQEANMTPVNGTCSSNFLCCTP